MCTADGRAKGSITVYCSLVVLLIAALLSAMLESAHQSGAKAAIKTAAATGLDSLFSMYDQGLFEQYGLLFLNEELLGESVEDELYKYVNYCGNPNEMLPVDTPQLLSFKTDCVTVTGKYYANDKEGVFFMREVMELMKYQETASLMGKLISFIGQIENADQAYEYVVENNEEYANTDWSELAKDVSGNDCEEVTSDDGESGDSEGFTNQDVENSLEGSIITQVQDLMTDTLLRLFVEDVDGLSDIKKKGEVTLNEGFRIGIDPGFLEETAENVLFDEYVMSYMSNYLSPSMAGGFAYEAEYVISGEDTDKENLINVLNKILIIRMGLNIVFLLTNSDVGSEADLLAQSLVGWTGLYALVLAVKLMLVAVWAFCESVLDIRTLLSGKEVPFFKGVNTWTTGITDCVAQVASGQMAKNVSTGLGYEMYLRILLLVTPSRQKILNTMNEIQFVMEHERGKFSFEKCVYAMEIQVQASVYSIFPGFNGFTKPRDCYQYEVRWSQMY